MSKSEIQSWLSTASTSDDNDNGDRITWQRDRVLNDWPRAMQYAQDRLMDSKTKSRTQFLNEELLSLAKHGDLNLSQTLDVFKLLTLTYPRYSDSASREAVESIGMELVRRDEVRGTVNGPEDENRLGVTEQILGWLSNEVYRFSKRGTSSSYAPSDIFVLLSWTCGIFTTCMKANPGFPLTPSWRLIVVTMALLFDMIQDSDQVKPALKHSALVRTRRSLRSAGDKLSDFMSMLLTQAQSSQTPLRMLSLVGVAMSVLIRLKTVAIEPVARLAPKIKGDLIELYLSSVLLSKTLVPSHVLTFLHDFISTFISADDLSNILPTMEKSLLRSPELSLPVIIQFFRSYSQPLTSEQFGRVLTQIVNSSKSSNVLVRQNSTQLFKTIISLPSANSSADLKTAADELFSLPLSSKTAGPDHRIALYSMLAFLPPSGDTSPVILKNATTLLAKETHEAAVSILAGALPPHISFLLQNQDTGSSISPETMGLIAKEMASAKLGIRRAFVGMVGKVFLAGDGYPSSDAGLNFAKNLLPCFDNCLKNVSTNPLNSSGGPLEGYVAIAVLLGPLARLGKFDDLISKNPVISSIITSSVKPSFLLWDKDQTWLLRACDATMSFFKNELLKNGTLRSQLGLAFLHLGVEGLSPEIRKNVHVVLQAASTQSPQLTNKIVSDALTAYLSRPIQSSPDENVRSKHSQLSNILFSITPFDDGIDQDTREVLVAELVILGHHPAVCAGSRQTWIDICQKAKVDPRDLAERNADKLLKLILDASVMDPAYGFPEASYGAISTLTFVAAHVILPRVMEQLQVDINPTIISSLSATDLGIWATPEGTTFVDVLASSKDEVRSTKGKDYEIAKWEDDLRKSLANKKASSTVSLTKQQQALVQAQLAKESEIRQRVVEIKISLERGLRFVRSLVAANVDEFQSHISFIAGLLLTDVLSRGSVLVGDEAFNTYLELAKSCSDRLDTFRRWVGIATLRSLKIDSVPQEFQAEPLNSLIIRVLYRLRFLSEQAAFDAATFSYAFPLLAQVLIQGGIAVEEEDDPLEQIALALDIIKFHCSEFVLPAFPRVQTIERLLDTMRQQPKLSKEASSSLVGIGEAISTTTASEEISILLHGTLLQEVYVRNSCLQTLQPFDLTDLDWSPELWVACHDDDEQNARLARHIWDDNGLDIPEQFLPQLIDFLAHENAYVRTSTAAAIAEAVEHWPQTIHETVTSLQDYYREKAKILAPEFDEYGMVIAHSLDRSDPWPARLAASGAFEHLAPLFSDAEIVPFLAFLIQDGALGDRIAEVRRGMLSAGTSVIDLQGAKELTRLISMFENHLGRSTPATEADDHIKEAVVILFGRVARHLDATDPRIPSIVDRLIEALKTPAEQVQIAVSDCLSPLVRLMRSRVGSIVDNLMEELFNAPKYAARRGAAYGLAGVLKGTGISGMKEFDVIGRLRLAIEDKKRYEPRQGVMFAFETLSTTLGRLFEPYITYALPLLLASFGDTTTDVREATQDAARVIMGNMSGYGVKLILPSLLSGLDEKQWRTKKGSIELLGMMAYCSPRQLSLSLPIVIPRLTGVLTDSHAQVRTAANKSLKQFGEVISNPEIQSLVPVLLKALVDPAKTPNALSSLLKTSFMHYIDHSSLALVVPILERGLRERGADTKKKAAQIVGNLASLTDSKDFVPYLSGLLPLVHTVLVDPVPEARATAAKALGTLVERLGEGHFPDLVPGLLRTLKTDTSGVDRQGAAQGLSEVLSGLGMERLEGLLPDIIANAQSPRATVREGFMSLLVFLPATFGTRFQPHLPKIITPILNGLSDIEEYVREAAMRAGRMVVTNYSNKAIDLLLPELEHGMFDPGWRIRHSSVTLVGELLFKVSGISGKASDLEEEEVAAEATSAESSRRALVEVLGLERRDRILAALYLVRQDGVVVVRQLSIQIWKALVHNTPRTVREILGELINQIVVLISASEFEQQETAARTVTELCRKFGEKILAEIIPILKTKSTSTDARTREGVCLTLSEIIDNTTETQREGHEDDMIMMVRTALVDDEANVRSAAAKAFDVLQDNLGAKAIDQTIPTLLEALRQPGKGSGTALQALREVMAVRASTVFPVLIPTLTAIPMTVFNARALASLVTVAGNALSRRLTVILSSVVKVVEDESNSDELQTAVDEALRALLASINDAEGLNTLMMMLLGWAKHDSPKRRVSACNFFALFCEESALDSSFYRVDWIRQLVSSLEDSQVTVHTAASSAFDIFIKSIPKDELEPLVVPLRRSIESTGAPGHYVPGFGLPKGIAPTVPIIIAGLTTGSNEQREQAAYAIGDLVERTEEQAIKPFVVPFTGPLIRVATQATTYPPAVKTAILTALTSMLERIPLFVKPFFPQLQRTFVKSASDPASAAVRNKASQALGALMKNQPRVDPVVTELLTGTKNNEDSIASSLVHALANVLKNASTHVGEKARESCIELITDAFKEVHDEQYNQAIATLFVSLSNHPELLRPIVQSNLILGTPASVLSSHIMLEVLSEETESDLETPGLFEQLSVLRAVAQKAQESASNERPNIARPAREARDLFRESNHELLQGLF
ncbi:armadillo-type protein [Infundibulicybe gibba]|nr:armadillo-type protein [Infundibulicybe gibba]